ncbi:UDP-N-acetylmuramoyl-tripeptide--D-alanyl-D-alanine ligase [Dysgonomonadaceae bacterium PH5-43]|nr:UDP-N-acetylmuramoyl-tripeptide--D-alanyl-D-alanine ligase [Dysgonomonadaceae bacterium PH5-43]
MQISELYNLFVKYPNISIDSRNCETNSIFFAIKGDRFDGNNYVEQALNNGAAFAVADKQDLPDNEKIIKVENSLITLQQLALYHRQHLNPKVIAITGTNGKTTSKELVATALSAQYQTLYTQGNLNNHIGVPLTLLRIKPEHKFAVIEMGANHQGEIKDLCKIADPDYGLITNIGKAHLEGFGSFEGIIKTKTELYDYLRKKNGVVFANKDNEILSKYHNLLSVVYYASSAEAEIKGNIVDTTNNVTVRWSKEGDNNYSLVKTNLSGTYNLENILAAITIADYFGVSQNNINNALENYLPTNNRSQTLKTENNNLLLDAYNANPSSMLVSLTDFGRYIASPKIIVLGEMKELGEYSEEEHLKVLNLLKSLNDIDKVLLVGDNFKVHTALFPINWRLFSSTDNLIEYLQEENIQGYNILIKGSRGNQLERVVPYL